MGSGLLKDDKARVATVGSARDPTDIERAGTTDA